MRVPRKFAVQICHKARNSWNNSKKQQEQEKSAFRIYQGSKDPKKQDQAHKFGSEEDGKITTRTQAPLRPWVVNLDEPDGQKYYNEAMKYAKEKGIIGEEDADTGLGKELSAHEMDRPKAGWGKDEKELKAKLQEYLDDNGITYANAQPTKQLLAKAESLFDAIVENMRTAGLRIVVK